MLSRNLSRPVRPARLARPARARASLLTLALALLLGSALVLVGCAGEDDASMTDDDLDELLGAEEDGGDPEVADAAAEDDASDVEEVEVVVPDVAGEPLEEALDRVEADQLEADVDGKEPYDPDAVALVVSDQRPEADATVTAGEAVTLTVEPEWVWGPCKDVLALDERFPSSLHGEEDLAADGVEVPYEHAWPCEHLIAGDQDEDRYEAARELADLRADEERFNQFAPAGIAGTVDDHEGNDPLSVFGWAIAEADAGELDDVPTPDAAGGLAPFMNHTQVWNEVVTPVRDTLLLREDIEELDAPPEGAGRSGRFGYVYSEVSRPRFDDPDPQLIVAWYEDDQGQKRALVDQAYVELGSIMDEAQITSQRAGLGIATRRLDGDDQLELEVDGPWLEFYDDHVVDELTAWQDEVFGE